MLTGVVEQYHVQGAVVFGELLYAVNALAVYGDADVGELLLHLERLVTNVACRGVAVGQQESPCFPFIASAEHGHLAFLLQQPHQILHVGRLARSAHGDVAHRDDGHVEGMAFQQPHFKAEVAQADRSAVDPAQRQQTVSDFDEVAFHVVVISPIRRRVGGPAACCDADPASAASRVHRGRPASGAGASRCKC